jgi:hypothetical protein
MEANSANVLRLAAALGHQSVLRGKVPLQRHLVGDGRLGKYEPDTAIAAWLCNFQDAILAVVVILWYPARHCGSQ